MCLPAKLVMLPRHSGGRAGTERAPNQAAAPEQEEADEVEYDEHQCVSIQLGAPAAAPGRRGDCNVKQGRKLAAAGQGEASKTAQLQAHEQTSSAVPDFLHCPQEHD